MVGVKEIVLAQLSGMHSRKKEGKKIGFWAETLTGVGV